MKREHVSVTCDRCGVTVTKPGQIVIVDAIDWRGDGIPIRSHHSPGNPGCQIELCASCFARFRLQFLNVPLDYQELADELGVPVHRGCGAECTLVGEDLYYCHGCDRGMPLAQAVFPKGGGPV